MLKNKAITVLFLILTSTVLVSAQVKPAFSGESDKYGLELIAYMGPNLKPEQSTNLNKFIARWDSSFFSNEIKTRVIDISKQLSIRSVRSVPHFYDFLVTVNGFFDYSVDSKHLVNWLNGLVRILGNAKYTNEMADRYFRNTLQMISSNTLFDSGTVRWKVRDASLQFAYDTVFYASVANATLVCYSGGDSTQILKVSGKYYPLSQLFKGTRGLVTWEKAGFPAEDVFVTLNRFNLNTSKSSFTFDSVKLTHKSYFREPALGSLTDQTVSFSNPEKANYPRFVTYKKDFLLKNLFPGINYEGGLAFEGYNVKGTGENFKPAKITLYRHDTLYIKVISKEFAFTKTSLNSQETSVTLYFDKDSIYHSNLGLSYLAKLRQINIFRTNSPLSKSPYFDSYHKLEMYFEYLIWNMDESKITLSRMRGSSIGQAQFESSSYFDGDEFMNMMGLDDYHPLNRLVKFAEWYYSETFPVAEFAKWLKKPVETVTGMCIDLATKGFLYYDHLLNEVTIMQKTKDYLTAYSKKKDYDIINILSKTSGTQDNAILDLKTMNLTVNGVSGIVLSDSQLVAVYPYRQQIIIKKNRDFNFDGVVKAGLFTIFGHNFSFSYNNFMLKLLNVDSIKVAVETGKRDMYGKPLLAYIDNPIQLANAEVLIDKPDNKSGLKSLQQYPIITSLTDAYVYYDRIPGFEGIYKKKDFYFKIDPFTYQNIDHYSQQDLKLAGEFVGGNILKPMRQYLTIQENNSLGFRLQTPAEGLDIYEGRGKLFNDLSLSNKGLIGSGSMKHLTSTTVSDKFSLFPDSMLTQAVTFNIERDGSGLFPELRSKDVKVRWLTRTDEWIATNATGKYFDMFGNGTTLDGSVNLTPSKLLGTGVINMTDSRITSNLFSFASNTIRADTADYNLKSLKTSGYSFISENAKTDINFDLRTATFRLNTDSSAVKFPEIQYICTMTDFRYDMDKRILSMEQKGKSDTPLLTPDKLIRLSFANLDKPTFFATNSLSDTIAFSSWKGSYHLNEEYIQAENINYIHIADALIQPDSGKIIINRRARIQPLQNAIIALNNRHILHSANVDIESTKRYSGSGVYDYVDENNYVQQINFPELMVDTLTTSARGTIPASQKFMLSPAFSFAGDVFLTARSNELTFTGAAGITHNCSEIQSSGIKFKAPVDPKNILIPIGEKPRDANDNIVRSGSLMSADSIQPYPAFLTVERTYNDAELVKAQGWLFYDKPGGRYIIGPREKIVDRTLPGNMVSFDRNFCIVSGEGKIDFGAKLDLFNLTGAGKVIHTVDSGKVNIEAVLAMDFFFSPDALKMMADEIRMNPTLKAVDLTSEVYSKGMKEIMGSNTATRITDDLNLFGTQRELPKDFAYELLLSDVKLYWNRATSSYRSKGKIGLGFVGQQPLNVYMDGYVEIQRRRSGDMIDIYLKADGSVWYYFSYFRGVLMTQAGNLNYNTLISNIKLSSRKNPDSSVRVPYTYMIAAEDRLKRFLRRMESDDPDAAGINY